MHTSSPAPDPLSPRWSAAQSAGVTVRAVDCLSRPVVVTLSDGTEGKGDTTEIAMADALDRWERRPARGFVAMADALDRWERRPARGFEEVP